MKQNITNDLESLNQTALASNSILGSGPLPSIPTGEVNLIESSDVAGNVIDCTELHVLYPRYGGERTQPMCFHVANTEDLVAAVLHHAQSDQLVLVQQFRPAALLRDGACRSTWNQQLWQTEVVAGALPCGADPESVIRQEILEETGCRIANLTQVCEFYVNPALLASRVYLYFCEIAELPTVELHGREDEGEDIRVLTISVDTAIEWAVSGRLHNSLTLLAISLFAVERSRAPSQTLK
ncbi:NUDIX hydrolase [Chitiniphilus purpureus]|uniref:NUDIX hydrolase n=1 Tax=Chitiniphilus purpureus TaxID=2981137 RepID=A0ABY6DNL8_9NEIS|nr:NUDIX hydrolase [Chitiniphilus sp. CD1]UXY15798.1 NUDIX hydrolase [Chitiniphilus sp. CD1]